MKISVAVITYNQENTINQTIDGILAQEGDFDLEIVIGEDCSSDNTYTICKEYAEKFPTIIKLIRPSENLGILRNFINTLKSCTGELIGICAGDDYWIDKNKLSKQKELLDRNIECGVCTTNGYRFLVRKNKFVEGIAPLNPIIDGDVSSFYFSENYSGGVYAMPLSMVFRSSLLRFIDFDEFIKRNFSVEDYPLQAIFSKHTKWCHLPDLTVVYRVYNESATNISYKHPKYMFYHKGLMEVGRYLEELYPGETNFTEEKAYEYILYKEFLLYLYSNKYRDAKLLLENSIYTSKKINRTKKIVSNYFLFSLFRIYKLLRQ